MTRAIFNTVSEGGYQKSSSFWNPASSAENTTICHEPMTYLVQRVKKPMTTASGQSGVEKEKLLRLIMATANGRVRNLPFSAIIFEGIQSPHVSVCVGGLHPLPWKKASTNGTSIHGAGTGFLTWVDERRQLESFCMMLDPSFQWLGSPPHHQWLALFMRSCASRAWCKVEHTATLLGPPRLRPESYRLLCWNFWNR